VGGGEVIGGDLSWCLGFDGSKILIEMAVLLESGSGPSENVPR
jgi:hypothetical protein